MPVYGVAQAGSNATAGLNLTSLISGDDYVLFNAETLTAPQASVAFAVAYSVNGEPVTKTFTMDFASSPTAALLIQGANVDTDANYQTLYTSTNIQHDNYTDTLAFKYYRAKLSTGGSSNALTVRVHLS